MCDHIELHKDLDVALGQVVQVVQVVQEVQVVLEVAAEQVGYDVQELLAVQECVLHGTPRWQGDVGHHFPRSRALPYQ